MRGTVLIAGAAATLAAAGFISYRYISNAGRYIIPVVTSIKNISELDKSDPGLDKIDAHKALLTTKEYELLKSLVACGQGHLFSHWQAPGIGDGDKRRQVAQLMALHGSYHGGITAYISNAKKLLQDSKEGKNPFEGYTPKVPHGERLDFASAEYLQLEEAGLREAGRSAFVLVAGGLGERLGYSGIKVALPAENASGTCFLELYIQYILALQVRSGASQPLPLTIMTSDDTHARTEELLTKNSYFGMKAGQITLIKQEKVACLTDNEAHLALDPQDPFLIQTKPHGHGDVHALLHSSGLASKWKETGLKWVCFFQDTNALVFRALIAALAVSAKHDYDMNSLAVPRKAKEAIGAISLLEHRDGSTLTINVEYNQLDPLLRATINKEGDVNDTTGWSPFPGNINQLVLKLDSYVQQLSRTGGVISEFVNPKYKDSTKTVFKSSTRLECMMQDYPKALPQGSKVGFTTINQVWASYSPVKNSPADALAKFKEGNPTHSATSGEMDIYRCNCLTLKSLTGMEMPEVIGSVAYNGIEVEDYPKVVLSPRFAPLLKDIQEKIALGSIRLAPGAVLILDGPDISVKGPLTIDGALVVRSVLGSKVSIGRLDVKNAGWEWRALEEGQADATEEERIRGFRVIQKETKEYEFKQPGVCAIASPMLYKQS
ncbi:hypothetical protein CEUSTIGMA_g978.t1 [Chlamydomonas eustigma]|uniref:UTP-monosaccharide-1-phosphate uridylyltransferase n=1 Tax=Chlamydomonas eustigma TaxID=1157962 RepID=A0A250WS45_9CHLO|nr:hypothetical protein CEUSTIGMA_g978.t1 [Chlamydomonas eustigma]|eukprot:GAX73526.1 hypothetical protein CEUSTIGMA_g978.t1 [Chlamydomonas eustigma]